MNSYWDVGERNIVKLLLSFVLALSIGIGSVSGQTCPQCYNNQTPMGGQGTAADGRRIIKVQIDSSWDVSPGQTNANIWNATE
jgi:hypothetical protein